MMNCILVVLQVFAFIGLFIALGIVTAGVQQEFIFLFTLTAFTAFIVLSAISFWAEIHTRLNGNQKWSFGLAQVKLGSVILHSALGIRVIFGDSSNMEIGYFWSLFSLVIGAIMLIGAAIVQMRNKTVRLSSESIGAGLAATLLALAVCWWAVSEAFYVFYAIWGFWTIKAIYAIIPRVNRFALSTKNRLYWTIHVLFFWIIFTIIVYVVTDDIPVFD